MLIAKMNDLFGLRALKADTVAASSVKDMGFRLDASAYLTRAPYHLVSLASRSGKLLSDLANVYTVYIQTPVLCYVEPFEHSRPYLTTSELGEYQQVAQSHVSLITDPRLIDWKVEQGYLVLSRSGRVGEIYWIGKRLVGVLVGDSFRVVPRKTEDAHFLYALLASPFAKGYLTGITYGSVVDHASVDHARSMPVPDINPKIQSQITVLIRNALESRESAYQLLDEADDLLAWVSQLPRLRLSQQQGFDPLGQPGFFTIKAKRVHTDNGEGSEYRLDAHYYNPTAELAAANLRKCRSAVKLLRDVAKRVFMVQRFKRNYVDLDHGVPFLSGKNVMQIRPTDLKYLSNLQVEEMQELMLERGWTLITCSGTIGRTCFVWKNYENHAASQHILRVIPDETEIDPGYLYAFLSSSYGYEQILRYRHGSVIDEVTDKQIEHVLVPCPSHKDQEAIGNMVREAYEKRAEAIRLEDEAQAILMNALTTAQGVKGV